MPRHLEENSTKRRASAPFENTPAAKVTRTLFQGVTDPDDVLSDAEGTDFDLPQTQPVSTSRVSGGGARQTPRPQKSLVPFANLLKSLTIQQRAPVSKPKPPEFSGTEDVQHWRPMFELAVTRYENEEDKIISLSSALTQDAWTWFSSQYSAQQGRTLRQWLDALEERFPTDCRQKVNNLMSRKFKVGKDVPRPFVTGIASSVDALTCCRSHVQDKMNILSATMSEHPQFNTLLKPFPGTTEELIGRLENDERGRDTGKDTKATTRVHMADDATSNSQIMVTGVMDKFNEVANNLSRMTEVFLASANRAGNVSLPQTKRPLICYECRQEGHIRRECPKLANQLSGSNSVPLNRNPRWQGNANRSGSQ